MKLAAVCVLLLASCSTREVGNALLPDEITFGRGQGTSKMSGDVDTWWEGEEWPVDMEGESESTYAALTWHLPSIEDSPSRKEREQLRSESLILDVPVVEEEENGTINNGATLEADWRHAAIFSSILGLLLIIIIVKLQRSIGWH